jgi:hypothetical protein
MRKTRATLGTTGVFAEPVQPGREEAPAPTARPSSVPRPDRRGRAPLPFWTSAPAKKQLRLLAAEQDTTQQDLMTEALNLLFDKYRKPPIA